MKSIWLENKQLSMKDVPQPVAPPGEALIRVRLAGICATDLELVKGYYPYSGVPGHEFVGEVASAEHPGLAGKRVVGEINAVCHECETCLRGDIHHCENRTVLGIANRDGAFAEYLTLPVENLHVVPENVPDEAAVFTEPLAAALEILDQVEINPSHRVLVIGAGRLGQLISMVLAQTGCQLLVSARHPRQRELLASGGIAWTAPGDIPARKFDFVVEATGSQDGFYEARRCIRPRGTIVLKSTYAGEITVNFSPIVVDEVTLVGSRCGPFNRAVEWLAGGRIDPTPLIEARYPLADGLAAFEAAGQSGRLKVLLDATIRERFARAPRRDR